MNVVLLTVRLVLAVVFVAAAAGKLAGRDATRGAIAGFGVPPRLAASVGIALPTVELGISVGLLIAATATWAAAAAALLLVCFCVAIARLLARGETPDCHCFGGTRSAAIGRGTLARNAVLLVGAGFVAVAGWNGASTSATAWIAQANIVAFAVGGVIVAHAWFSWQLFRQNGRLLERVEVLEGNGPERGGDAPSRGLAHGVPAPPFALPDLDGEIVSLSALLAEGTGALLFFTDPGCGHCDPLLPALAARSQGPPLAVISRGSVQANRAKAGGHGLSPILLQDGFEVADAYGAYGMPAAVLVDPAGRIASDTAAGADSILALLRASARPRLDLVHAGGAA